MNQIVYIFEKRYVTKYEIMFEKTLLYKILNAQKNRSIKEYTFTGFVMPKPDKTYLVI